MDDPAAREALVDELVSDALAALAALSLQRTAVIGAWSDQECAGFWRRAGRFLCGA